MGVEDKDIVAKLKCVLFVLVMRPDLDNLCRCRNELHPYITGHLLKHENTELKNLWLEYINII